MIRFLRFLIGVAVILVFVLPLNYFLLQEIFDQKFSSLFYFAYAYFIVLISVGHLFMLSSLKKRPQRFVINFMALMGIKIFLSLIILVIVLLLSDIDKKIYGVNFMVLYLLFSAYSIAQILKAQKKVVNTN